MIGEINYTTGEIEGTDTKLSQLQALATDIRKRNQTVESLGEALERARAIEYTAVIIKNLVQIEFANARTTAKEENNK